MAKKTMVISMGHGGADGGSYGADKMWERDRIRNLCKDIKKSLPQITLREEKNSSGHWKYSNRNGYTSAVSMHFNAFDKKATGVEVIYKKSSQKAHAEKLSKELAKAMGVVNRGAKYDARGLYMMNIGFDFLIEVCFHDNPRDLEAYKDNYKKVVQVLVNDFSDLLDTKPNDVVVEDDKPEFDPECYERKEPEPRYVPKVTLGVGENEGDETNILRLQKFFRWLDYEQKITKELDKPTLENIKKFQKEYGLEVDGYFGKKSREKAKIIKDPREKYERRLPTEDVGVGYGRETNVLRVQKFLSWYGIDTKATREYDDQTIANVKKFQRATGLKADGSFGEQTRAMASDMGKDRYEG